MDKQLFEIIISSLCSGGAISGVFIWFIKTQIQTSTDTALSKAKDEQFEKDIIAVKLDLRDTKTNFNVKFADSKLHVTAEVNRAVAVVEKLVEKLDKEHETVEELQRTCAARHGL